jgi:hypothetical protein
MVCDRPSAVKEMVPDGSSIAKETCPTARHMQKARIRKRAVLFIAAVLRK